MAQILGQDCMKQSRFVIRPDQTRFSNSANFNHENLGEIKILFSIINVIRLNYIFLGAHARRH